MGLVGDKAKDFVLKDQDGNEFRLSERLDKKVLLVFYPKDNSPVCTKQIKQYNEKFDDFGEAGILPVGINTESPGSHKEFREEAGANLLLLSDPEKKVSMQFNALNLLGMNKRKLVLIGEDSTILYENATFPVFFDNPVAVLKEFREKGLL